MTVAVENPRSALLALALAIALLGAVSSPAFAGSTNYCTNAVRYSPDSCRGGERHTYNDNWVFSNLSSSRVCGFHMNPSTGTTISFFCDYDYGNGVYRYYRDNNDVFLDVYVRAGGIQGTRHTLRGNAGF